MRDLLRLLRLTDSGFTEFGLNIFAQQKVEPYSNSELPHTLALVAPMSQSEVENP